MYSRQSQVLARWLLFVFCGVALLGLAHSSLSGSSSVYAYQAEDPAMSNGAEPPAAKPNAAAPARTADDSSNDPVQQKTFLKWLVDASGPFGACIFIESFLMVALIIMAILQFRRENFLPPEFIEEFEGKLNAGDYKGAYESAKQDESLLARMLVAGMTKVQKGPEAASKAIGDLGDHENMGMEHRLSWLALIATTGPMFGLLGTVQGMVQAFEEIANSNTTPKPSELAEGIQLALVTTLEGLIVAIPAMVSYALLRNRLMRLMFDVGILVEQLMARIQSRPATPSATPPTA